MEGIFIAFLVGKELASAAVTFYNANGLVQDYLTSRRENELRDKIKQDHHDTLGTEYNWEDLESGEHIQVSIMFHDDDDHVKPKSPDRDWTVL